MPVIQTYDFVLKDVALTIWSGWRPFFLDLFSILCYSYAITKNKKEQKGKKAGQVIIEIDFNSQEAIYIQLRNQIVVAIAQDKLKEGQSLPSVRQMADNLGVNMHTVNKAYSILKQEGYLKLDRRKGAVISVEADKDAEMQALYDDMEMLVARAVCKGISREEMTLLVQNMYDNFEG